MYLLPHPLHPKAEVSTVNRKTALYELATVAAVLRVAPQPAIAPQLAGDQGAREGGDAGGSGEGERTAPDGDSDSRAAE